MDLRLKKAVEGICTRLGIDVDKQLLNDYQCGWYPNLLSYEKVEKPDLKIPSIQKYLIGAQTILNQPCQFYDIYRLCRHYFIVQLIDHALSIILDRVANYQSRLDKLLQETLYDSFDSIMYELIVASQYALLPNVYDVKFLDETEQKSPDFEFIYQKQKFFVECKKFNRHADAVSVLRDVVREKTRTTLRHFLRQNWSAVIEISFHCDPNSISSHKISSLSAESYMRGIPIEDEQCTVKTTFLKCEPLDEYFLYPSPKYYLQRYRYAYQSEWFGLVNLMKARFAYFRDCARIGSDFGASTWLDNVDFDCAIKWKLTDNELIWRLKKFNYRRLFKGLEQLQAYGQNSILHVWYERDWAHGHRQDELIDFFLHLHKSKNDVFSWIIFNETVFDTSTNGIFDFLEHAHPISGPSAIFYKPLLTTVFTNIVGESYSNGEFGVGYEVPDFGKL